MPGRLRVNARWGQMLFPLAFLCLFVSGFMAPARQSALLPIGQIQGRDDESPFLDRQVGFQGIVTGIREDQNAAGIRYYTFFVQGGEALKDGDPLTSDGIAVFTGRTRPRTKIGDSVEVWGVVTEFYGLTEIDDRGLYYQVISSDNPLPVPVELNPPAEFSDSSGYYERYEGMLVEAPLVVTVGPTHSGCGFSVLRDDVGTHRILKHSQADSRGDVIKVLYFSDLKCSDLPALFTGDRIEGIIGPLTYHFDQFKLVLQETTELDISEFDQPLLLQPPQLLPGQFTIASFNLENYFDSIDDTGDSAEPKPSSFEIGVKQFKLAQTIAGALFCPTMIAVQEVEKYDLLAKLSRKLTDQCGFIYEVSHLDTADGRGSDLALFSQPARVDIKNVSQYQTCSEIETEIIDPAVSCAEGENPLFARQPFIVNLEIDGMPLTIINNHFKSKRGGEEETGPWRIAQSQELNLLIRQMSENQTEGTLVVLGDFNDYDQSPTREALNTMGSLFDALISIPENERYSYIFDGESQLTDWILVSPNLSDKIIDARIAHINADYPYQLGTATVPDLVVHRSSDHDIPIVTFDPTPPAKLPESTPLQAVEETADAKAERLPATRQSIHPELDSGSKDDDHQPLSDEGLRDQTDETIKLEDKTVGLGSQDVTAVDDLIRLPVLELVQLALGSLLTLMILVIVLRRRRDRR